MLNPKEYIAQCEHDVCSCGADPVVSSIEGCACVAFETYARACAFRKIILNWRTDDTCCEYICSLLLVCTCAL